MSHIYRTPKPQEFIEKGHVAVCGFVAKRRLKTKRAKTVCGECVRRIVGNIVP